MAEKTIQQPKISEAQISEAFGLYGYTPDAADLKYWSLRDDEDLKELYDKLNTRKEMQTEAESNLTETGLGSEGVYGESFFRGGDNGALIKFSEDPDGAGPQSTSTVWLVEPGTKTLRPILSETAFNNYFEETLEEASNKGMIKTIPMNYMSQGSPLFGYKLMTDEYGVKEDGSAKAVEVGVDIEKISGRYGYENNDELNKNTFKILNGFLSTLKGDQNSGLSQETIDNISNNKEVLSMYINALAYGNYKINDIYRDLKIRESVKNGNTQYTGSKAIDEGINAEKYYNTPAGNAVRTNPDFAPPAYIGDIDSSIFDMPIFDIPSDVYETLVPPFDWKSPEGQSELDTIKSAYHDVLLQQAEATTEREKAIADQTYKTLQEEIGKKYGIALSDNSNDAWSQLVNIGTSASQRGLSGTGLAREEMDKHLSGVRKQDQRNREAQLTEEENQRRIQLMKYGTPEQIAALSDEEKEKYGFKPTQEVLNWFSKENLKANYPDLSDREIENYRISMLDEGGNYRSQLYQKLATNKLSIGEDKQTYQLGNVQTDPVTGKAISGSGVLYKKALEEEKAYEPFSKGEDFSKPTSLRKVTDTGVSPSDSSQWSINKPPAATAWKAPSGYQKISGPSQLPKYSNIIDQPGTINKWGVSKDSVVQPGLARTDEKKEDPAVTSWKAPTSTIATTDPFAEWTKGKTDILGKGWKGYGKISGTDYDTDEKRKQYQNVQQVGKSLYGYK